MLKWLDILQFANKGNPAPDRRVEKTEEEWATQLTPEQFRITRQAGTERPNSSPMCSLFEPGKYACACCGTPLFDATEKFESGTGWPSFTQPLKENAIAYHKDLGFGRYRIETLCNTCDAHLGHVFQDGPPPSGLRYCINAEALTKMDEGTAAKEKETQNLDEEDIRPLARVTFGGGCFWCTESMFRELRGVREVRSGYSGGQVDQPTYKEVCSGQTGHAEVVEVTYDPSLISHADLLHIHLATHDPTTLNRQGADKGTQYRSIIFYRNEAERKEAEAAIMEMQTYWDNPIVTELQPLVHFFPAEDYHQNYLANNPQNPYCQTVVQPKLAKFRKAYRERLRE